VEDKQARINDILAKEIEELIKTLDSRGIKISFSSLVNHAVKCGFPEVKKTFLSLK